MSVPHFTEMHWKCQDFIFSRIYTFIFTPFICIDHAQENWELCWKWHTSCKTVVIEMICWIVAHICPIISFLKRLMYHPILCTVHIVHIWLIPQQSSGRSIFIFFEGGRGEQLLKCFNVVCCCLLIRMCTMFAQFHSTWSCEVVQQKYGCVVLLCG